MVILLTVVALGTFVLTLNIPDLSVEKITSINQTLMIYDKNGNISTAVTAGQNRVVIDEVPVNVKNALLATEDIRFYEHNGIDIKRIVGAVWSDIKSASFSQGASTITQQLIKNSQLSSEKNLARKINEAVLALQLERLYSKEEIMVMYLNIVYFGRGAYGIQTAAQSYFGVNASELSVPQAALLIGILKAPNKYAPHISLNKAIYRRNTVLEQMNKYGFISEEELCHYKAETIVIADEAEYDDYGYYTDYVLEEGANLLNISVADLLGGGYRIYTSLDTDIQCKLQEEYDKDECFPNSEVQSSAVVIDNATGGIAAMIGGREHEGMRVYNRAVSRRQPGSTIKPLLVYAPALDNGSINAATVFSDRRKSFGDYSPTNFNDLYYGNVTVRKALSLSLNIPAVEILEQTGIEKSKQFARSLGIEFDENDRYLALALGGMTYGTTALNIASAYSSFANSGIYIKCWCVDKITDNSGETLYQRDKQSTRVMKESTAYIITDILCDVSKHSNNLLNTLCFPIACKTGTVGRSVGYSDAWSASYIKDITVCVWMGYDRTDDEHYLDDTCTGSTYPSLIASKILDYYVEQNGYRAFDVPSTIVRDNIDLFSVTAFGKAYKANENTEARYTVSEVFDAENTLTDESDYWNKPKTPEGIIVQLDELRNAEIVFEALQSYVDYSIIKNGEVIGTVSGEEGKLLRFTDKSYSSGDGYTVLPCHKTVKINGIALTGKESKRVFPYE